VRSKYEMAKAVMLRESTNDVMVLCNF